MELRVVRTTDRFDETCRFYGEVLGWPVTKEWDADEGQGRGRIFGHGASARIELIELLTGSPEPVAGVFVSAEVDDVAAVADRLAAAGIALDAPLTVQPWGHRSLAVIDPIGLRVVLFEVL
jgi:catechol 2,3-dioxygenase-like lactoylglutathione lyase family enzyme